MMPNIQLLDVIKGNDAVLLESCFPKGVIGLKTVKGIFFINVKNWNNYISKVTFDFKFLGVAHAYIKNCRIDNSSRNVFRYKQFDDKIILSKIQDHFICKFFI